MIHVKKQERNTIFYSCDCGAKGMCSFKPLNKDAAIVIDLKCPSCQDTERMTIVQYKDEAVKKKIIRDINSMDLSWVFHINEEVFDNGEN